MELSNHALVFALLQLLFRGSSGSSGFLSEKDQELYPEGDLFLPDPKLDEVDHA
jgi:hypothetical protein